jgi:hypothetical protein
MSPIPSTLKQETSMKTAKKESLHGLHFNPENDGGMFLQNVGWRLTDYTALHPEDRSIDVRT